MVILHHIWKTSKANPSLFRLKEMFPFWDNVIYIPKYLYDDWGINGGN